MVCKSYTCTVIAIRSKQCAGLRTDKLIRIVTYAWKLTDPACGSTAACILENSEALQLSQ
ncbi:MAG: hypothetical protein DU480_09280 [Nitrosomonas sp.]